jgi:site-specific recombinase XerD
MQQLQLEVTRTPAAPPAPGLRLSGSDQLAAHDGLVQAFRRWALARAQTRRGLSRSSQRGYAQLWRVFLHWMDAHAPGRTLESIDVRLLHAFVRSRQVTCGDPLPVAASQRVVLQRAPLDASRSRYVWRLLRLIDQVLEEHARAHELTPNRSAALAIALHDLQHANAGLHAARPQVYSNAECAAILEHVSSARPRPGRQARGGAAAWTDLRDCAAVALHLGAGLTPAEVRRLRLADVTGASRRGVPWRLRVLAAAQCPEHDTPIAPWAGQVLAHWLRVRDGLGMPGTLVFATDRLGTPWNKDDHYDAVRRLLHAAGLDDPALAGGGYRLRHTFALRQLRHRHAREQVASWLGIVNAERLKVYDSLLDAPVDGVV